nr:DinB family protein [Aridibaculum aurantiacum]
MVDVILSLPPELQVQEVFSSFNSLHLTLSHMWYAESIWWQRLKLVENPQKIAVDVLEVEATCNGLLKQSRQWEEWVNKSTEAALAHEFVYRNSKKEQFKQPVSQVLLHMFNHATYHRGQLVTMLRNLGVEKIPSTDFIEFSRRKK